MPARKRLRTPSPATVIALIALFVALGGAAYAVKLGNGDVKSRHIARHAVKGSDLRTNAVKPRAIRNNAVNADKIANGAVDQGALADDAVTRQKIKAQAVTTPKIADGAVETAKIADANVTAAKLAPNSVTSGAVKREFTEEIDPDVGCGSDTIPAEGIELDDHVLVTVRESEDDLLATGAVEADAVIVRYCSFGMADPAARTVNVLVID
ncbi:MAG TPA: hypothetical protein VHF58_07360 [Solirubrobacterales bacterium]|nr:hypothetical protein [Solirubrobacterales bacterium]